MGFSLHGRDRAYIGAPTALCPLDKFVNPLTRPLGLEIELGVWGNIREGMRFKNFSFSAHRDSSVQPSQQEMVLNPLVGDRFVAAMLELGAALHTHEAEVNNTCGLHVHVGARDYSWWDIRRLGLLYVRYEQSIFDTLITKARLASRYCKRIDGILRNAFNATVYAKTTQDIKEQIIPALYGEATARQILSAYGSGKGRYNWEAYRRRLLSQRAAKYGAEGRGHECRYFGLNLHSWMHRGTIEWRMKEGTTDIEELVCWPLFCGHFVDLASRLTDAQIAKEPSSNILDFISAHMPKFLATWAQNRVALRKKEEEVAAA